jgi:hypothetical protein
VAGAVDLWVCHTGLFEEVVEGYDLPLAIGRLAMLNAEIVVVAIQHAEKFALFGRCHRGGGRG